MPRNQKLTRVIKGRTVRRVSNEAATLIIAFYDGSTMTVKIAGTATAEIAPGCQIKAISENGNACVLQFEDGSSVALQLIDPGASIAVRDQTNAIEYLG